MPDPVDPGASRAAALRRGVERMPGQGTTVAREQALARAGAVLMVAGLLLALWSYRLSFTADVDAQQRDATVLAIAGLTAAVVGAALFLRYSVGQLLRFWLARLVAEAARPQNPDPGPAPDRPDPDPYQPPH